MSFSSFIHYLLSLQEDKADAISHMDAIVHSTKGNPSVVSYALLSVLFIDIAITTLIQLTLMCIMLIFQLL